MPTSVTPVTLLLQQPRAHQPQLLKRRPKRCRSPLLRRLLLLVVAPTLALIAAPVTTLLLRHRHLLRPPLVMLSLLTCQLSVKA